MAGLIQNLLTDTAAGFFGNEYLRDFTHASKTFRTGAYGYAPKFKHLFHVYFDINPAAIPANSLPLLDADKNFGLAVKTVQLPKYSFDLHEMNQYNRKRIVQTKIKYDPVSITFHDDNNDLIRKLWHAYYTYYYKDAATPDMAPGITNDRDIYNPNTTQGHDWGYIGEGASAVTTATVVGTSKPAFFKTINVFGFNQHNFSKYTYVNPVIETFSHDSYSYAESGVMENSMTLRYETVKYYSGQLNGRNPGDLVNQFGDQAHYDRTLSPIARPGSNASVIGPNGLVDSASSMMSDLASGNILGAVRTGGSLLNTFKNPAGIVTALKSDALGLARDTVSSTPNRNTLFNFPAAASSVVASTSNSLSGLYKSVAKSPKTPPSQ